MKRNYVAIALIVVLLDRLSKWFIAWRLSDYDTVQVLPGFFELTDVHNSGAAFGLLDQSCSPWKIPTLILIATTVLVLVSVLMWKVKSATTGTRVALSLIMGGAAGNLWDRLVSGQILDCLDFYVGAYHWATFNVADAAVIIGAFLLVRRIIFDEDLDTEVLGAMRTLSATSVLARRR